MLFYKTFFRCQVFIKVRVFAECKAPTGLKTLTVRLFSISTTKISLLTEMSFSGTKIYINKYTSYWSLPPGFADNKENNKSDKQGV